MRYRLVGTYLALLALVLLALEIPLATNMASGRTEAMVIGRFIDAARIASVADPALRTGRATGLVEQLRRYHDLYQISAAVTDRDGRIFAMTGDPSLFATGAARQRIEQALAGERVGSTGTIWPWQDRPLAVAVPVTSGGEVVGAVLTLSPTGAMRGDVQRDWLLLAAGGLAASVVCVAFALALSRWILRPIAELGAAAARISGGALDARVSPVPGPAELRALAESFNAMADSVSEALLRQRAFVAQASHQLRNPLTALRLRVEELGELISPGPGDASVAEEHRLALEETDRLGRILDGLLELARAERRHGTREAVDAAAVADERVAAWRPLAAQRRIDLYRCGADRAMVVAVPTAVGQSLDALIDNALKFAGAGSTVRVDVRANSELVALHVIDDGPGLSDEERRHAVERFWRAPDAQNIDGSGLGLPIVLALAEASGGRLDLFAARPHGLDARASFPAVKPR